MLGCHYLCYIIIIIIIEPTLLDRGKEGSKCSITASQSVQERFKQEGLISLQIDLNLKDWAKNTPTLDLHQNSDVSPK